MRVRTWAAVALLSALAPAAAASQAVRVEASLSEQHVVVGETTVLRVTVRTTGSTATIELPTLPPQVLVTGTQDFMEVQTGADGRIRLIRKDVVLRAIAPGAVTIGSVTVRAEGRDYTTARLLLEIDAPPISDRTTGGGPDVMLIATIEPDTVYVGDQIMLRAEALFTGDLRQRQSRPASYQAPSPTGFWVQDLDDAVTAGTRLIDGDVYESQTFRRVYFPLEAGEFTMEPARLVYELRRGLLQAPESRELASDSLHVVVLPLPDAGRPASFTGAVGDFEMSARLEPRTVAAGEAATLTVELTGRGNIKALPPPRLAELDAAEVFPPTEESDVGVVDGVVQGSKRFQWVIVPERPGRLEIGPLEYAFFDPVEQRYATTRTGAVAVTVAPAGRAPREPAALAPLSVTRDTGGRLDWVRSPTFVAAQAIPLLILLGSIVFGRRGAGGRPRAERRRRRRVRLARLESLRAKAAEGGTGFLGELDEIVREAAVEALGVDVDGTPSRSATLSAVEERAADFAPQLAALFASIDTVRFAPGPALATDRVRLVAEAKRIVERIARTGRKRRGKAAAHAGIALCLAAAPAASAAAHQIDANATPAELFDAGVAAYRAGDVDDAAAAFESYLRARPSDANGWSNLGSAYYRAGELGDAAWAWLRALAIEPRRADARHNLRVAGGPAAPLVPPIFAPTAEEAGLIIAVLWWASALAIAAGWLRRPLRRAILVVAVFLAGATAGAAAVSLPGRTAIVLEEQTPILAGPAIKADALASLPVASPVRVIDVDGAWTRVRTRDGIEGWIESAVLGRF